jgi:hypothetical protein
MIFMTLTHNTIKREFFQKQGTVVQGTWAWLADALQTYWGSVTGEAAGYYSNSTNANLDEYKWSSIFLTKGSYKITITSVKKANEGIMEMLFGTTSLGTSDMYALVTVNNQTVTLTFTLTYDQTADLRFRVNGRNASNVTGYYAEFSRMVLEKTS